MMRLMIIIEIVFSPLMVSPEQSEHALESGLQGLAPCSDAVSGAFLIGSIILNFEEL